MNGVINKIIDNVTPHSPLAPPKHFILTGYWSFSQKIIWLWHISSLENSPQNQILKVSKPFFHISKAKDTNVLNKRDFLSLKIRQTL